MVLVMMSTASPVIFSGYYMLPIQSKTFKPIIDDMKVSGYLLLIVYKDRTESFSEALLNYVSTVSCWLTFHSIQ